jgi:DNA-binding NtrC family response regulator
VVLAHGREIRPADIPPQIREGGARLLPVRIGPVVSGQSGAEGRELEFILRSLVELKLQMEELRRRLDEATLGKAIESGAEWLPGGHRLVAPPSLAGIEPRGEREDENVVSVRPGMTMAQIERAAIEAALRETRGNRRKAADMLGIGERTMYRKLREYQLPVDDLVLD